MAGQDPGATERAQGSVLVTVLLLVSVLSVLAVAVMDDIGYGIKLAGNRGDAARAQAFALGAEDLAVTLLEAATRARPDRNTLQEPWAQGPLMFPLDDGFMRATVSDASNCFNVNSLVDGRVGEALQARSEAVERYKRLLEALEFNDDEQTALANALVDWIDTDGTARNQGAEDYHYLGLDPPYRAANGLVADVTELRALRGYTVPVFRVIARFVCAHETTADSKINVNTLREADAPLLVMLAGPALGVENARELIRQRSPDGYGDLDLFFLEAEALGTAPFPETSRRLVSLKTDVFDLKVLVVVGDMEAQLHSLLRRSSAGTFAVAARRSGEAL
ncbi:MAG: type II secretion system minor pseudopilin GspK [Alphaproteobacteria bacterium]